MKIEIDMPDWRCEELLDRFRFVTEDVTAYYTVNSDPYGSCESENELKPIRVKVSYREGKRPMVLSKERPMLEELELHRYENVVSRLFNTRLFEMI